jgi:hypothetical protein
MARREAGEGEEAIAGFLQAVGDGAMTQPPPADEGLTAGLDFFGRGGVDHVGVIGGDLVVQALGRVREEVPVLMTPLNRHAVPDRGDCLSSPGAPSTMRKAGGRRARSTRSSRTARQASVVSPPMLLSANNTFWPSSRTPMTTSNDIEVALRSSRTRTTVPSRISRTIGSSASERAFQASQSAFTFRHGSSCPCRPHRRTAPRVLGGPGGTRRINKPPCQLQAARNQTSW